MSCCSCSFQMWSFLLLSWDGGCLQIHVMFPDALLLRERTKRNSISRWLIPWWPLDLPCLQALRRSKVTDVVLIVHKQYSNNSSLVSDCFLHMIRAWRLLSSPLLVLLSGWVSVVHILSFISIPASLSHAVPQLVNTHAEVAEFSMFTRNEFPDFLTTLNRKPLHSCLCIKNKPRW